MENNEILNPDNNSENTSEDNVIQFPESTNEEVTETNEPLITDEQKPLNSSNMKDIKEMIKNCKNMVDLMQSTWEDTKEEFKITNEHIKALYNYNEVHRKQMPEDISEEDKNNWDHFNGLNEITEAELDEIFDKEHPIWGVSIDVTRDRVKGVIEDWFNLLSAQRELSDIELAYRELMEIQEDTYMEELKALAEKEEDEGKKAKALAALDNYYNIKTLGFLSEKLTDDKKKRLIEAFGDKKKIDYWLNRTRDKLGQLGLPQKVILEISQFEKRFMEEKYYPISNMLLLYFMNLIVYTDLGDKKNDERSKVVAFVMALDTIIRNGGTPARKELYMNNIKAFLDQMIEDTVAAYPELLKKEES